MNNADWFHWKISPETFMNKSIIFNYIFVGWSLSEDHILYTLGHQSLLLKEHSVAASLFNDLLAMTSPGLNPIQQVKFDFAFENRSLQQVFRRVLVHEILILA
jgi:hypothetical protein